MFANALSTAQAATYAVTGHVDDRELWSDGTLRWIGQTTMRVGGATAGSDGVAFYIFELPSLASGESVASADLSFTLLSISNTPTGKADLHGFDYRSATTVSIADYYQGSFGGDSGTTPIQDDILTLSSSGVITTDSTGSSNLATYLDDQYTAGAQGGDYVILRLNIDVSDETNYYYYNVASANNSGNEPVLSIQTTTGGGGDTQAPSVPTGLASSNVTASSVDLDWNASTDNVGVTGYKIYTNGSNPVSVTGTSATVTNLSASTSYTFTVSAVDAAQNESAQSSGVGVTTSSSGGGNPEQRFNLYGYTDVPTFPYSSTLVWPSNVGDHDICLWNDDRFATLTITIDDNTQPDHSWWLGLASTYGLELTWFVITEDVDGGNSYYGTWSGFQSLANAGHSVQSHTVTHSPSSSDAEYIYEYEQSQIDIDSNISGQWAGTLAYPSPGSIPPRPDLAADYYIGARGTTGTPNKANQVNYLQTNSTSGRIDQDFIDSVVYGTSGISWLAGNKYLRGWLCTHFHLVQDRTAVESDFGYIDTLSDQLWIDSFYDVIRFIQERDTANVDVTSVTSSEIRFDLTDWMDDTIYDFPLTIKFRVANDWNSVTATQNGQSIEASTITYQSNQYVLVKAVPDAGEVIISKVGGGSDTQAPSVPTGLASSNVTATSVDLDWNASTDNVGVTGYKIYTNGSNPVSVTGISATVTNLSASTSYTFAVSAVDAAQNESSQSSGVNVTTQSGGSALISEDFSSSAANFTAVNGGSWSVSGGRYVLTNPATPGTAGVLANISVHDTTVSGDFVLTGTIQATGTSSSWNDAAVVFGYQDTSNYYYLSLNESNDGNTKGILKVVNGTPTELADISVSVASDTDYPIEIVRSGSSIVAKVNGAQVASATDSTFTSGKVGFATYNDGAEFDDLVVTSP